MSAPSDRCGHSACSQNFIDTGETVCVRVDRLPNRSELSFGGHETCSEDAYSRAAYFVARLHYPTLLVATSLADQGIAPANTRERYLLSLCIESIREHERRLKVARTKLAAMRADAARAGEVKR